MVLRVSYRKASYVWGLSRVKGQSLEAYIVVVRVRLVVVAM